MQPSVCVVRLSIDVMRQLLEEDPVTRLLLSLTCCDYRCSGDIWPNEVLTDRVVKYCSVKVIRKLDVCNVDLRAARFARIDLLRKYAPGPITDSRGMSSRGICKEAARGGDLKTLQWCLANGYRWGRGTTAAAASEGHFELLQWCIENDCQWGFKVCKQAAKAGHLHIPQWIRSNGWRSKEGGFTQEEQLCTPKRVWAHTAGTGTNGSLLKQRLGDISRYSNGAWKAAVHTTLKSA
jgi:hypothetical protein